MKGMIPDTETGIIKIRVDGEDVNVTFVRVNNTHIQHLSSTNQLVRYHNMPPNVIFIETQADKGTYDNSCDMMRMCIYICVCNICMYVCIRWFVY